MQTLERTPSRAPYHDALAARMEVVRLARERAKEARRQVASRPTTWKPRRSPRRASVRP